ncbi:glycerophosphodiester phosphodiesterase [Cellulomonas sp. McL0617]|uniref:glycerophosphodiester phosphodiesterase n=1 Tax=Cellulomonas sp. McL0617 TaxID=3415675 RepID=UPI003CF045E5
MNDPRATPGRKTLVSAHRGGVGRARHLSNTLEGLRFACSTNAAFVEFDVQKLRDGALVLFHDDTVRLRGGARVPVGSVPLQDLQRVGPVVRYEEALAQLAEHGKGAHVDVKFHSDDGSAEVDLARSAVELLGPELVVVTTGHDASVAAIRAWSRERYPELLVGLTIGRPAAGQLLRRRRRRWLLEQVRRLLACDANLAVVHKAGARLGMAREVHLLGLPLLVWTVDRPGQLAYWLTPGRAWMVTTNRPDRASARSRAGSRTPVADRSEH